MAGASVTKTAQLASVSIGTATSAFRSMGKTSLNTYGEIFGPMCKTALSTIIIIIIKTPNEGRMV